MKFVISWFLSVFCIRKIKRTTLWSIITNNILKVTILLKTKNRTKAINTKSKSYFNGFGLKQIVYTTLASFVTVCVVTSCSSKDENHTFQSPKMAIESYSLFLADFKQEKKASIQDLTKSARSWLALSDSVWSCIKRDTTQRMHYYPEANYHHLHDSIREEMYRLAFSQPRTFKDVVILKAACTPYSNDTIINHATKEASTFFDSLDNNPDQYYYLWH